MFFGNSKLEKEIEKKDKLIEDLRAEVKKIKLKHKEELKSLKKEYKNSVDELKSLKFEHDEFVHKVEANTNIDIASGAHNQRYFYDIVESMISLAKRDKSKLSLVLVNINKYENLSNENPLSNQILQTLVHRISGQIRESDVFVRLDKAKFVVALPKTSFEQAKIVCEKLKLSVANEPVVDELYFSLSVGAAEFLENENVNNTLKRAEELLKVS